MLGKGGPRQSEPSTGALPERVRSVRRSVLSGHGCASVSATGAVRTSPQAGKAGRRVRSALVGRPSPEPAPRVQPLVLISRLSRSGGNIPSVDRAPPAQHRSHRSASPATFSPSAWAHSTPPTPLQWDRSWTWTAPQSSTRTPNDQREGGGLSRHGGGAGQRAASLRIMARSRCDTRPCSGTAVNGTGRA